MAAGSITPCFALTTSNVARQQPSSFYSPHRRCLHLVPIHPSISLSLSRCYSGGGSGGRRGGGGGGGGGDGYEEDDDEVRFRFYGKLYRFDKPASVATRTSVSTSSPNSVLDTIVVEMGLGLLACWVIEKMTGCFSSLFLSESGKEAWRRKRA